MLWRPSAGRQKASAAGTSARAAFNSEPCQAPGPYPSSTIRARTRASKPLGIAVLVLVAVLNATSFIRVIRYAGRVVRRTGRRLLGENCDGGKALVAPAGAGRGLGRIRRRLPVRPGRPSVRGAAFELLDRSRGLRHVRIPRGVRPRADDTGLAHARQRGAILRVRPRARSRGSLRRLLVRARLLRAPGRRCGW